MMVIKSFTKHWLKLIVHTPFILHTLMDENNEWWRHQKSICDEEDENSY